MPLPIIPVALTLLNDIIPKILAHYKEVRAMTGADKDPTIPAYTDADLIAMLKQDATTLVAHADAVAAKWKARMEPPPTLPSPLGGTEPPT